MKTVVPKTVVIDARMAGPQPHGIGRYVEGLLEGLFEQNMTYRMVALTGTQTSARLQRLRPKGLDFYPVHAGFLSPSELFEIPRALKRVGASLYHTPSFSSLLYCPCKHVQTIHDLNHLTYGGLAEKIYYRTLLKPFARRARTVMTVSATAQNEIAHWLGVEPGKISVLRNPIDILIGNTDPSVTLNPLGVTVEKYFVCVTNPKPHKNVDLLLRAFKRYRADGGSWPLVITVKPGDKMDGVIPIGNLGGLEGEARLADLLSKAGALVSPSLYEGFGRPPVEALLLETPVIVSDIPVHREALEVAAPNEVRWTSPTDETAWVQAFKDAEWGKLTKPSDETRWDLAERHEAAQLSKDLDSIYQSVLGIEL